MWLDWKQSAQKYFLWSRNSSALSLLKGAQLSNLSDKRPPREKDKKLLIF